MSSDCPPEFPKLETHDDDNQHGDVCRNDKVDGFNIGWICPKECQPTENRIAPFCQIPNSNNEPCRVSKGTSFNFILFTILPFLYNERSYITKNICYGLYLNNIQIDYVMKGRNAGMQGVKRKGHVTFVEMGYVVERISMTKVRDVMGQLEVNQSTSV